MLSTARQSNSGGSQARKCLCTSLSREGGWEAGEADSQGGRRGNGEGERVSWRDEKRLKRPVLESKQTREGGGGDPSVQRHGQVHGPGNQSPELLTTNTAVRL